MSVIAAMDCGEFMLLAADGLVTEEDGVKRTEQKLEFLNKPILAWGFAGVEGIGYAFGRWLRAQEWDDGLTWEQLANSAIEELSRLNGRQRYLSKLAGVEATDNELADVLLTGYVGGVSDIYELTDRGNAASVKHNHMAAIGSGKSHARIAYETLRAARVQFKSDEARLGFLVGLTSHLAPMCGGPIRILKVAPDGITDLTAVATTKAEAAEVDKEEQRGTVGAKTVGSCTA